MASRRRQLIFAAVSLLLAVGCLEIALGLLAFFSPSVDQLLAPPDASRAHPAAQVAPPTVPDARLGYRPNPAHPGHDARGFRNPGVPVQAHIVALGDSQTYGAGVAPEEAWPRQLEALIGKSVYSMAYGGYGPVHSLVLLDEALALSPDIVIEAFYAGNDLFDAFDLVYNRGQFPELKSPDPQVQASVLGAERAEPIAERVSRMFRMDADPPADGTPASAGQREDASLRRLLARRSKLYGLARRARHETARLVQDETAAAEAAWGEATAFAAAHPDYCQVFDGGTLRTVFTSEYRHAALDGADPRIAEGQRIALEAMRRMDERAGAAGVRFLVLLLPTKEAVFRDAWREPSATYRGLVEDEERLWQATRDFLASHGIEYLDALPALRGSLATPLQPYPVSYDGHPNASGHRALAALVATHLEPPGTSAP